MYNFHIHTVFCDGISTLEEFVEYAIKNNFRSIGFSSHAPTLLKATWQMKEENLSEYIAQIDSLKQKYSDKIQIYKGLEVDFIEGICSADNFQNSKLEYLISSVHYVKSDNKDEFLTIDHSPELFEKGINDLFEGNIKKAVSKYYSTIRKMLTNSSFDIIAHIDLIKKFNHNSCYFNEKDSWYIDQLIMTIDTLRQTKKILEINTRGVYKSLTSEFYPSNFFLNEISKYKIPIVINSDSHHFTELNLQLNDAEKIAENSGITNILVFYNNKWKAKKDIK